MNARGKNTTARIAATGGIMVLIILVFGTFWMGRTAKQQTEEAVRTVSLLYLDELAGRREQVVESNLQYKIRDLQTAVDLMEENDLSDKESMEKYQQHMKKLYALDRFAFVDTDGLIYTATGTATNIADYSFDYSSISEPEISVSNLQSKEKKVVIAIPVEISFQGKSLKVAFMEISMQEMLSGVSMDSSNDGATFCNIYTSPIIQVQNGGMLQAARQGIIP